MSAETGEAGPATTLRHSTHPPLWGEDHASLRVPRRYGPVDLVLALTLVAFVFGVLRLGEEWTAPARATVEIDLSPWALPRYTLYSLSRGLIAYVFSLGFSLVYGFWAAKSELAARVLVPALDVLQSIPVLGFMPGLVLALVAAFPRSNVGLELAAVIMIFTGQAWNMTFSFYYSLRSVPQDQREVATAYRFSWWERLRWVELPFSTIGLVWNSMMSMAGGWFFLMINEAFVLGDKDFRLPGLGSYMSVAVARGDGVAMLAAIAAMASMIILLDQVLWRPVVVWAEKFRVEEGGQGIASRSWVLDLLRKSRVLGGIDRFVRSVTRRSFAAAPPGARRASPVAPKPAAMNHVLSSALFAALLVALSYGGFRLVLTLRLVHPMDWLRLGGAGLLTLGRVVVSTAIGTLWAVPAGLAIGLSPRLSRWLQPVVQVLASFPAPMLFPVVVLALLSAHVSLGWGSIVLMLLGTQWYILFNVIAGASAIPSDLREAARSYRLGGWQRFRVLYLPAVFPHLVTGWVTAAGGAWNASIVSEFVTIKDQMLVAPGLGARISQAASAANFPLLASSVFVMSLLVVTFNRVVWRRLHDLAQSRFSLDK
ncbi:MAG: ABC transporter permease subunit [Myxococcota bacterium]|nr:ABC transporter permease subunit [Myxococcota bacterium]